MSSIKKIINKILYPKYADNNSYIKYLKKSGVSVGKNTYFFSPKTTTIDVQNGIFIEIGSNCKITKGVTILAHDYSYSVFRPVYHNIPKKAGKTQIGDNIPDNEVWGGNPAKFICTLDDYYSRCKNNFESNAFLTIDQYKKKYKRYPTISELQYFSLLFINNQKNAKREISKMKFNGDNKKEVIEDCIKMQPKYSNYEELIEKYEKK